MAQFSGAVKIADLNDYLTPNQSCIKPLLDKKKKGGAAASSASASATADSESEGEKSKANSGTKMKVEFDLSSSSDASDLRFPGLQSTGGAMGAANGLVGYETNSNNNAIGGGAGHFAQMKLDPVKKTATVSLNDCLACSGCVTSAETVLITQQSIQEFINILQQNETIEKQQNGSMDTNMSDVAADAASSSAITATASSAASSASDTTPPRKRVVVVSISPQSLTALAHEFHLTPLITARKLTTFFQQLGVRALVDTTPALDIALIEAKEEFIERFKHSQAKLNPSNAATASSIRASSTASSDDEVDANTVIPTAASPLPILSSECPGWICYCEKTQGLDVLAHASSCKSPQAIMGTILKEYWAAQQGLKPDEIYHTSIMPCYDKKLEGSRDDFFLEQFATRETDCVLTTSEVLDYIKERSNGNIEEFVSKTAESELDPLFNLSADKQTLFRSIDVGGSGGYCEYLFRAASQRLFNVTFPSNESLPYKAGRNPDFRELSLEVAGKTVLSFALAYGFRNIQNLVRKMKTKKASKVALSASAVTGAGAVPTSDIFQHVLNDEIALPVGEGGYQYVEVMACPSGCLNGGGQLKAKDIKSQKQLVADLDHLYHEQRLVCEPEQNPVVQKLYKEWLGGSQPYQGKAQKAFHTQFHAVEKDLANPLGIKW